MNALYTLTNGQQLQVVSQESKGMAGEPMTMVFLTINKEPKQFRTIKHLMKSNDANDLGEYLDDINEANNSSAISHVI